MPTYLTLHNRYPDKYPNYLCQRCQKEIEDLAHILTCEENERTIEEILKDVWENYCKSEKIQRKKSDLNGMMKELRKIYIKEKIPFGIITEELLVPIGNRKENLKHMPAILHQTAKEI